MAALKRIKKVLPSARTRLPKPKLTFDRIGQLIFTVKEVLKIAFRVKPKLIATILIINSLLGFVPVTIFYLEKLIIDELIDSVGSVDIRPALTSLVVLVSAALLISLARNILQPISNFIGRYLSRYFDVETDVIIGSKLATLDIKTLEDPEFRDKLNKIERESSRRAWQLMMPISQIPNFLFGFITAAGVIMYIHPLASLIVILLSLPRLFVNQTFIKRRYSLQTKLSEDHRLWGWLRSYLLRNRNFLELKLLNISGYLIKKMKNYAYYAVDSLFVLGKKHMYARVWTYIPLSLFELVISVMLIYWVIIQRITVGTFQLYIRSLRSVEDNLAGLVASFSNIYENYIYVADLVWLMNLEPKITDKRGLKKVGGNISIDLNDVWFKYQTDNPWVLKNVDINIKPGEKIALVGENGAGKSTLIKLIARFYDPDKGKVEISKVDLKKINPSSWQESLAVLFQQFEKYPFSAKETIGYGDVKKINDIKGIKKVAEKVGLVDFIEKLPKGYDNPLAPEFVKGVRPSIGQWQRFGIARMLFRKDAKVLILDEPTSNVDPEAEEKIFKELVDITKEKILIFVTQRYSTVRIADRILVMHKGKIVEEGTHNQLIKRKGRYERLFNLQAKAYLENER